MADHAIHAMSNLEHHARTMVNAKSDEEGGKAVQHALEYTAKLQGEHFSDIVETYQYESAPRKL